MIFTVEGEKARWIQKTLSRLRCKDDWSSLASREACWTPAFLSALIDEVDYLLTAGLGKAAYALSQHLQVLAERIRAEECPKGELDKRSLVVWAMAVHASSCRQTSAFAEAELAFVAVYQRAGKGVLPWAQADLDRRYAACLTQRNDRRAFEFIECALNGFAGFPERLAETLILRGVARHQLDNDNSGAISDFTTAAGLVDPRRNERCRWNYHVSLHNMSFQLVLGDCLTFENIRRARQFLVLSRSYFGQGMCPRKLTSLWVEGLLAFRLGWNRHSERLLEKARKGFLKLACFECAMMVSIDLALVLLEDGEPEQSAERLRWASQALPESLKDMAEYSSFWKTSIDRQALLQTRDKLRLIPPQYWRRARASQSKD